MPLKRKPFLMKLMACSVIGLLSTAAVTTDATAGFKWTGPVVSEDTSFVPENQPDITWHGDEAVAPAEQVEAVPMIEDALPEPVTSEILATPVTEDSTLMPTTTADAGEGDLISQIVTDTPAVAEDTAPVASIPALEIDGAEMAQGFGTDIPLVMAIRQIVPAKQAFAFEKGVNLSQAVSWQGGKAWPTVLSETLATVGLYARAHNDMLMIGKAEGKIVPAAPVKTEAAPAASDDVTSMAMSSPAETSAMAPAPEAEEDFAPITSSYFKPGTVSEAPEEGDIMSKLAVAGESKTSEAPATNDFAPALTTSETGAAVNDLVVTDEDMTSSAVHQYKWNAKTGETLRNVVTAWAEAEGVQLFWTIDYDYRVQADTGFDGSFEEALVELLNTFSDMDPQPYGQLHKTSEGRVLVIKSYDSVG